MTPVVNQSGQISGLLRHSLQAFVRSWCKKGKFLLQKIAIPSLPGTFQLLFCLVLFLFLLGLFNFGHIYLMINIVSYCYEYYYYPFLSNVGEVQIIWQH